MTTIVHKEDHKIFDMLENEHRKGLPVGWAKVFLDNEEIHDGPNLIVANGREFTAQKLFETNQTDSGNRDQYYNHKISHFAIGSGGAIVETDDVTLTGPVIGDTGLSKPISLGDETYLNEPSLHETSSEDPLVHSYENSVKPINTHGSIYLMPVEYDNSPNYYTKVLCTCTIPSGEPSIIAPGSSVQISEAGLYFVNSSLADTDDLKVNLFARICFAPKWKELESSIKIKWYILC